MGNMQNTVQTGEQYDVTINDVAFGGDGVGRIEGLAVFVPFTAAGERVRIEITQTHARFARGRVVEVLEPSDCRVAPGCRWYGACAGCQYQHVEYAEQLRVKMRQIQALFQRIGKMDDIPLDPIVPAPQPYGYRTKIMLHGPGQPAYVGTDKSQRVAIDTCPIAQPAINAALQQWRREHPPGLQTAEDLHFRLDAEGQVWAYGSKDHMTAAQCMANQRFNVPLHSFFQVNPDVADLMATQIMRAVSESGCTTLIDAYGGVGVFGLLCADRVERICSIEADARAVRAGKQNAKRLGVDHIRFVTKRVEQGLHQVLAELETAKTICLLDPPRSGCDPEVIKMLCRQPVRRIVYISCAPDCLARDVKRLVAGGYELVRVSPYDMFPQTAHIEAIAELRIGAEPEMETGTPQ